MLCNIVQSQISRRSRARANANYSPGNDSCTNMHTTNFLGFLFPSEKVNRTRFTYVHTPPT